uniref:Invertebrate defensins family profile domain-containing protein n=1 Tax=Anopheles atroparvus TaxID=41427 RepID=A0A2C9GSN4_ANOAO
MKFSTFAVFILISATTSLLMAQELQTMCKLFTANVVSSIQCESYCVIKGKVGGYCNIEGLCTCRAEDIHYLVEPILNKNANN